MNFHCELHIVVDYLAPNLCLCEETYDFIESASTAKAMLVEIETLVKYLDEDIKNRNNNVPPSQKIQRFYYLFWIIRDYTDSRPRKNVAAAGYLLLDVFYEATLKMIAQIQDFRHGPITVHCPKCSCDFSYDGWAKGSPPRCPRCGPPAGWLL